MYGGAAKKPPLLRNKKDGLRSVLFYCLLSLFLYIQVTVSSNGFRLS